MSNVYEKYDSVISRVRKGTPLIALGAAAGLTLVYLVYLPQVLLVIGAGLLLLVFPISPANFLLAYLVGLSFLDLLIPFFTTIFAGGLHFGPQIIFRGGLIVLLLYYWLLNRRNPLAFRPAVPMFILFLLLTFSSLGGSTTMQIGLSDLAKFLYWIALLLTVADMVQQGKMRLHTIYRCVVISALCYSIVVIISPFFGIDLGSYYEVGDVRGPYGPHGLALCLCMGVVGVLALCIEQRNKLFLLLLLLFGSVMTISIARTYARTGYTSLLISMLVFSVMVWYYGKRQARLRRHRLALGLAFLIAVGAFSIYSWVNAEAFRHRISDFSGIETAGSGRMMFWGAALERYSDFSVFKKIFGGGTGAQLGLLGLYGTHNDYLFILLSGGILGIGLYLWTFISLWKQIKSTARGNYLPLIVAGSAMVIVLVASMSNGVILESLSVMTYFSFLVGGAMGYYAKRLRC